MASKKQASGDKTSSPIDSVSNDDDYKVHEKVLEALVCPFSKTTLTYDSKKQELISKASNLAFPIEKGVPQMTKSKARPLKVTD